VASFPTLAADMGVGTLVPIAGAETEEVATGPAGWSCRILPKGLIYIVVSPLYCLLCGLSDKLIRYVPIDDRRC